MKEYMKAKEIRALTGISERTQQRTRDFMRSMIGKKGGFSPGCVIGNGRGLLVRYTDFIRAYDMRFHKGR